MARWYILVLKTAAGGSTGGNGGRGRCVTIMKSSTRNGARRRVPRFFDVYVFGMSFCIAPAKKKSDIIFYCLLDQFNVVESP